MEDGQTEKGVKQKAEQGEEEIMGVKQRRQNKGMKREPTDKKVENSFSNGSSRSVATLNPSVRTSRGLRHHSYPSDTRAPSHQAAAV